MPLRVIFTVVFSCFILIKVGGQKRDSPLLDELNHQIKPVATLDPEADFQDIQFLKDGLATATVVGIGESTHGTSAFDKIRHRLIRFLVSELNYKSIIDEGDIFAAEELDNYINLKTDTVKFLGGLRPVVTNKKELGWLRSYNATKSEKDRVHIYGAEVRGFRNILSKITSMLPVTDEKDRQLLMKISSDTQINYAGMTKRDFDDLNDLSGRLSTTCTDIRGKHYLNLLAQITDYAYRVRFGRDSFKTRDEYVLENVKAVVSSTPGNKAIMLAHNGHIQKTKIEGFVSLGYLLNGFYGGKYYTIGTDFNTGNVRVFDSKTRKYTWKNYAPVTGKDAMEFYFGQCRYPDFIFPVRASVSTPALRGFVSKKIKMLRNIDAMGGILKNPIALSQNYDLIIFINNTG